MLDPWMIEKIQQEEEVKKRNAEKDNRLEIQIETPNEQPRGDDRDQHRPEVGIPIKKDPNRGVAEINFEVKPR